MGKVLDVEFIRQSYDNTCWKAVAKMVLKYMGCNGEADSIREQSNDPIGSAVALIMDSLGREDFNTDENPIPSYEEIKEEIDKGRLLIGLVATDVSTGENGHWIILNGYDGYGRRKRIHIVDPANTMQTNQFWLDYNDIVSNNNQYCVPDEDIVLRYFESVSYMPIDWTPNT